MPTPGKHVRRSVVYPFLAEYSVQVTVGGEGLDEQQTGGVVHHLAHRTEAIVSEVLGRRALAPS